MAETTLEINPASPYTILVTARFGPSGSTTIYRYCRWTNDITLSDGVFVSEPTLDCVLGQQSGGTQDKPTKLTIAVTRQPFARLVLGFKHPRVQVTIEQINPQDVSTRRMLFQGYISFVVKNPNGKVGLCQASIEGLKYRIADVRLSFSATSTCQNVFGRNTSHCRADDSAWERIGTVLSTGAPNPNSIELDIPSVVDPVTELVNARYRRGFIIVDGLALLIRESLENYHFSLFTLPPPWIVGRPVTLRAGCDGMLETCKLWDNEINFNGIGSKIPMRNPVFEQGS